MHILILSHGVHASPWHHNGLLLLPETHILVHRLTGRHVTLVVYKVTIIVHLPAHALSVNWVLSTGVLKLSDLEGLFDKDILDVVR